ncbi:GGDEF domain-containing protein [Streptomyces sp. NBC_01205]|uniref:GGDEF domain-containing protein n=1 Tax=Streptomyces sp. NBC_01205 TaxID=2903771 RepID=UPI002E0D5616|nr:GGDEF domain-containing protein [Streptomyces sp. NBC_01205]
MSHTLTALSAALPLAAGWSLHSLRLRRRIEAARRDPLTGLLTRDGFTELARRRLAHKPRAVCLIDLNKFKQINDTYGHAAGDAVIRAAGERLSEWAVDHSAVVGRLGGDEFAAVAPAYSQNQLAETLNRLTSELERPVEAGGHSLTVSASIGAVCFNPRAGQPDFPELLRAADEQMYRAKRQGAPWLTAQSLTSERATVNGRRAGRRGAASGTGAAA